MQSIQPFRIVDSREQMWALRQRRWDAHTTDACAGPAAGVGAAGGNVVPVESVVSAEGVESAGPGAAGTATDIGVGE